MFGHVSTTHLDVKQKEGEKKLLKYKAIDQYPKYKAIIYQGMFGLTVVFLCHARISRM